MIVNPSAVQAALGAMDRLYFSKNHIPDKDTVRAKIRAMIRAYDVVWGKENREYEIEGAERMLLGPIKSIYTHDDSGYTAGGKLDVLLRQRDGTKERLILDHKFLSYNFDNEDIAQLLISGQPNQYAYLGWTNQLFFTGAIWDVIVKSQHRRRKESSVIIKAAKPERALKVKRNGLPAGTILPAEEAIREVTAAETPDEFEERVFGIYVADPSKYFARPKIRLFKERIADHIDDLYEWTLEIDRDFKSGRHLRNTDACKNYNRPCPFLAICTGQSSFDNGHWVKHGPKHDELELPKDVDPFRIITNSRVATFKLCRLKHHYKYNEGWRRADADIDDNLYVGSAGHVGQEYYWKALKEAV